MPRKRQIKFNIDKKRLCFKQINDNLFQILSQHNKGAEISHFGGEFGEEFKLLICDDGRGKNGDAVPTHIVAKVILLLKDEDTEADKVLRDMSENEMCQNKGDEELANIMSKDGRRKIVPIVLGDLKVNAPTSRYKGLAFFEFDNAALYANAGSTINGKYNYEVFLPCVTETLGLVLNNVTELELDLDVNVNIIPIIRKLKRDTEHYDMIYNGKRVPNGQRLPKYKELFSSTRESLIYPPSLYFKQAKATDPFLRIYNKSDEIRESSGKNYISFWNDFGNQDFFRIEIVLRNEAYREFNAGLIDDTQYSELFANIDSQMLMTNCEDFKRKLWVKFADKIVYFREKFGDKRKVTLLDIAQGYRIPRGI